MGKEIFDNDTLNSLGKQPTIDIGRSINQITPVIVKMYICLCQNYG